MRILVRNIVLLGALALLNTTLGYSQQNVFSRDVVTTGNWGDAQLPWWNGSLDVGDPDDNNTTPNFVKIGHNNNLVMDLNVRNYQVRELTFEAGASSARTFTGNTLEFHPNNGNCKLENFSTANHIFNNQIELFAGTQINPVDGDLTFNGNILANGNFIDVFGSNGKSLFINGIISGTSGLGIQQNSIVVLNADNTYTGGTFINSGRIILTDADGLGDLSNGTTVATAAVLELDASGPYPENLILNGTGVSDGGALIKSNTGTQDYDGDISLSSDARINVLGGTLSLDGAFDFAGNTAYFGGTANFEFGTGSSVFNASKTTGNGAIYKDGYGALKLRPDPEISGNILLVEGEIQQLLASGYPTSGTIRMFNGTTYRSNTGAGRNIAKELSIEGDIILGYSGAGGDLDFQNTIDLNGTARNVFCFNNVDFTGEVTNGGLTKDGPAVLTLSADNTFAGETRIQTGTLQLDHLLAIKNSTLNMMTGDAGSLAFGTPTTYTIGGLTGSRNLDMLTKTLEIGFNNANPTYSGALSNGSLTKVGTGTLTLSGNNTYTGSTILQEGVLEISADNRIADGSNFVFDGGAFKTDGHNETVGTIEVNSDSEIQLSGFSNELHFQASDIVSWTPNSILTISGWLGSAGNPGLIRKIFVGTDNTGLTSIQLSQIQFAGYTPGAQILATGEVVPRFFTLVVFDHFNRGANSNTVGQPSGGSPPNWTEMESVSSGARINGSAMWLQSTSANQREAISYDMSSYYPVVFDESTEDMIWAWNMQTTRPDPSGFTANDYGAAFIIGCNQSNYDAVDASGYAVILGETGTDSLRLVRFEGGLSSSTNIYPIASVKLSDNRVHFSVNVSYTSCGNEWNMIVREEGILGFTNPSIGSFSLSASGIDGALTINQLPYLGAFWKHHTTGSEYLRIDNIYIPKSDIATDNVYTWNGGTGDYNPPSSWTPARDCARARDVLIFNGGTSVVQEIPNQTIGQIRILNNATVRLEDPNGDNLPSTLSLTGGADQDILVESGSTLIFDVFNTVGTGNGIIVKMNTGTTGEIAGTLRFDNTSTIVSPGGRPHQLLVTDADALHIKTGGRVEAIHLLSGSNPFGATLAKDAVIFESESTYLQASGSNPFGFAQPNSKIIFEPGSWYHYTSIDNDPSISGRAYANFKYEAGVKNITFGTTDYSIDTLYVDQGTLNLQLDANVAISGDIRVGTGAGLSFDPPASKTVLVNSAVPDIQNIYGAGNMIIGANATLNLANQNRINIQKNITITGTGPANILPDAIVDFEGENYFSGSGATIIQNGSKVYLGSAGGISTSGGTGNIRTTTRTYGTQAAYVYDGTANQITGTGLPATLTGPTGSLEIDNPGNTVTLTNVGTTTTPLLTLTNGLFLVGASNTIAITTNGSVNSDAGNFAAGNLAGTVIFKGDGNVSATGNLNFYDVNLPAGGGGVNFGAGGTPNIQHELVISNGRSVLTNGPFYADNSTLVYNTGGDFTAGTDWYAMASTGRGVPYNVQVGRSGVNNTKLNFGSSNAWRHCRNTLSIGEVVGTGYGFYLSNVAGGDLKLEGDFIVNAGGDFGANQSAVFFVGSTDQLISSNTAGNTVSFDYLIMDKPTGDLFLDDSPGTTVDIVGNSVGDALVLSNGDLDMQGQTINLGGSAPSMKVQNGMRTVKSSTPATFNVIGTKEILSTSGGALTFNNQVTVVISDGINFGPDVTTINATLQIDAGGYANVNAPRYGPLGVLKYNTGGTYDRRVEWNGIDGSAGFPNDVIVSNNTTLSPGGVGGENVASDFGVRRDVTIESGSSIYMDAGGINMTVPFEVGRNLIIDGNLSGSGVVGGDIYVAGNWIRSATGNFYPNDRQVLFNGTTPQTITASGGEIFDYVGFSDAGTKNLISDITVNKNIDFYAGSGALSGSGKTIHLLGDWNNFEGETAFAEANTTVSFDGTALQNVNCAISTFEGFYNLKMNNTGEGILLNNHAKVAGNLQFLDGLIDARANRIDFENTATHSGSGEDSYINGFARKTGFANGVEFMFPVGKYDDSDPMDIVDVYQPAGLIASSSSATAAFTVDYKHESYFPGAIDPINLPPMQLPLAKVSTCNFWNINRDVSSISAKVKLYWTDACFDIYDPDYLVVAKVNGGQWESHGQSAASSPLPFNSGYVISNTVSTFSPFAIGSTSSVNVLPIQLLSFTASAKNGLVETRWETSTEINNDFFTLERSVDAIHFEEVGRVDGAGNSTTQLSYAFTDDAPYSGVSYYRLKQTDFDEKFTYSEIRSVKIDSDNSFELLQVYRSESGVNLSYRSEVKRLNVEIYDLLGQRLFENTLENTDGRTTIYPSLARGIYMLRLSNGVEERVMKFFY